MSREGPERAERFAAAIDAEEITTGSPVAEIQQKLGVPSERLDSYREILANVSHAQELVVPLRASVATAQLLGLVGTTVEVAWTYPTAGRPGLRTTGGVAREIIETCEASLLLVGYSITVDPARAGLAAQTIDAIAQAAMRGVNVTAILHRDANREALLDGWPSSAKRPSVFTWPESEDRMAAIHAKVLAADRRDALVTSANLTYHGMEGNLEMGLRVRGAPAGQISDKFFELIARRDLVAWPGEHSTD